LLLLQQLLLLLLLQYSIIRERWVLLLARMLGRDTSRCGGGGLTSGACPEPGLLIAVVHRRWSTGCLGISRWWLIRDLQAGHVIFKRVDGKAWRLQRLALGCRPRLGRGCRWWQRFGLAGALVDGGLAMGMAAGQFSGRPRSSRRCFGRLCSWFETRVIRGSLLSSDALCLQTGQGRGAGYTGGSVSCFNVGLRTVARRNNGSLGRWGGAALCARGGRRGGRADAADGRPISISRFRTGRRGRSWSGPVLLVIFGVWICLGAGHFGFLGRTTARQLLE
jgi:hypothetical protein